MSDLHPRRRSLIADRGLLVSSSVAFAGFVALLVVVQLSDGATTLDLSVASRVQALRGAMRSRFATAVTSLGSFVAVVVVAACAVTGLWLQTRRLWASAILASSLIATASAVTLVKIVVGRSRPAVASLVGSPAKDFSFPSGHTANGTLIYVLSALLLTARLRHARWRWVAVVSAAAVALLIGASRVYLGYHWATDVLAGWLLAAGVITASYFTSRILGLTDRTSDSVEPILTPSPGRVRPSQLAR